MKIQSKMKEEEDESLRLLEDNNNESSRNSLQLPPMQRQVSAHTRLNLNSNYPTRQSTQQRDLPTRQSLEFSSETTTTDFGGGDADSRRASELRNKKARCVYCSQRFIIGENRKGSCREAPDQVRTNLQRLTCYPLAESASYHCLRDTEGDYEEPCSCNNGRGVKSVLRWSCVGVLALFLPCLCFYPCFMAIYELGRKSGMCGARHTPRTFSDRRKSSATSTTTTTTASSTPKTSLVPNEIGNNTNSQPPTLEDDDRGR